MKSIAFLSLVIFFNYVPKYSQQQFWNRPTPKPLPSNPTAQIYKELQKVPTPQTTANEFLDNFINFHSGVAKRQAKIEDIVIVLDGSGSVQACPFDEAKEALAKEVEICEKVPADSCLTAGVTFATSAKVNFKFLPPTQARHTIKDIQFPGGSTNTQAGLKEAWKLFGDPNSGGRFWSKKKVLLVTDGQSNVDKHLTIANANKLKSRGVEIHVIAVGHYITGIDEMAKVASYICLERQGGKRKPCVYRIENFNNLKYVFELALQKVDNTYVAVKTPTPCSYGR